MSDQPAPMIRTPQLVFRVTCQCGENKRDGIGDYIAAIRERDRLRSVGLQEMEAACVCRGSAWKVDWYTEWLPEPIATVRAQLPYAFALPPGALCNVWSILPNANSSPLPFPIAQGVTEAAAWSAAAGVVSR